METRAQTRETVRYLLGEIIKFNNGRRRVYYDLSLDIQRGYFLDDYIDLFSHMENCGEDLSDNMDTINKLSDVDLVKLEQALKYTTEFIGLNTHNIQGRTDYSIIEADFPMFDFNGFSTQIDALRFILDIAGVTNVRPKGNTQASGKFFPIKDFKDMSEFEQLHVITERLRIGESGSGEDKGAAAAYLRNLCGSMKLRELFQIAKEFMNITLRDFLNVNKQGVDYYTWDEVTTQDSGWSEANSWSSRFHQNKAEKTRASVRFIYGQGVYEDILIYTRFNVKFTHTDGREAVFDHMKKYVTELIDRGTYNYRVVLPNFFNIPGHIEYDVNPFKERFANELDPNVEILYNGTKIELLKGSDYWKYQVYEKN